jgi:hypothetical protein
MRPILRTSHDNIPSSREVRKLENQLRISLLNHFNHYLVPSLRFHQYIGKTYGTTIYPYVKTAYKLGSNYVSRIADNETTNSASDSKNIISLNEVFTYRFKKLLSSIKDMQRTENRRDFQIFASEKERIASQLSAELIWSSFNKGIKSKGQEINSKHVSKAGLVSMQRSIRSPDLKQIHRQNIYIDRKKDREIQSQALTDLPPEQEAELQFIFMTQQDEKVCEICRGLELQTWALADPDIPEIPDDTHPNCRCIFLLAESEEKEAGGIKIDKRLLLDLGLHTAEIATLFVLAQHEDLTWEELMHHAKKILEERLKRLDRKKKQLEKKK